MRVLMSIHPTFAQALLDGSKGVEYRRRVFRAQVSELIVYATKPVGRIVGVLEVSGILSGTPEEIWQRTAALSGTDQASYAAYFRGCDIAHAIQVRRPRALSVPLDPSRLSPGFTAPQSFRYVKDGSPLAVALQMADRPVGPPP